MPFNVKHAIGGGIERQLDHSPTLEREAFNASVVTVVDGLAAIRTVLGTEAIVDSIALFILCSLSLSLSSYGRRDLTMTRL